jgi:hypothetical protein
MSIFKSGIELTKRGFLINAILFAAFFTFYFVFCLHLIPKVIGATNDPLPIQAIFSFTIAGTLLVSSFLRHKLMKRNTILASAITTSVFTILLIVSSNIFIVIEIFLVGVFFSIGQLSFFVHFWNTTSTEERGRIGGLIGFVSLPFYFIINILSASGLSLYETIIIATLLSLIPIVAILLRPKRALPLPKKEGNYPEKRTILLYSIPWILFSVINTTLSKNIAVNTGEAITPTLLMILVLLQTIAALTGALIGGFVADFFGRRLTLALSVTLAGVSMGLSGLIQNPSLYYFVFLADGLSWGILLTLYSFVVWGDLSNKENCAKMYAVGLMTFYIAVGLGQLPIGISQISVVASAFLGCTLIFLSNLPILLAPELMPYDFREKIRLKMHMKAAKKAAKEFEN